ncbi:MAG: hypothetical protein PHY80_02240 [Rickettsiales bacterium]|nr:hypothetical protein [Rickettsiales bacterium]
MDGKSIYQIVEIFAKSEDVSYSMNIKQDKVLKIICCMFYNCDQLGIEKQRLANALISEIILQMEQLDIKNQDIAYMLTSILCNTTQQEQREELANRIAIEIKKDIIRFSNTKEEDTIFMISRVLDYSSEQQRQDLDGALFAASTRQPKSFLEQQISRRQGIRLRGNSI